MTLKQSIDQDVYTNSLLIYPYFDEENLTEFYWRRRNPFFFTNYYQKINQHLPDLSYQCTILDYNSVIELVILVNTCAYFRIKTIKNIYLAMALLNCSHSWENKLEMNFSDTISMSTLTKSKKFKGV